MKGTHMENLEEAVQHPGFKDRKKWLVAFGVFEIIIGSLFALILIGFIITTNLHNNSLQPMSMKMQVFVCLFYLFLSVWFIWMGIGSIKARRWARAFILVTSWIWLISGISGMIFMMLFMPDIVGNMVQTGKISEDMALSIKYAILWINSFLLIIMPGVFVLFYGSKNVKATCEFRNPQQGWLDKHPLPVLAISIMSSLAAGMILLRGFYGWSMMFFGFILSGMAGAGVSLVAVLLLFYVAWGAYKLNMKAWWCAVLMTIVRTISVTITYLYADIWKMYEKMNLSEQQLEAMKKYMMSSSTSILLAVVWGFVALGYLLYVRKYFLRDNIVQ
jgi:hypothetical protein